jgi:hypothetical protein
MSTLDTNADRSTRGFRARLGWLNRAGGPYSPALCLSFLLITGFLVKLVH